MKYRPGKIIFTTLLVFVVAVALGACVTDTGGEHDNTHQTDNNQTGGDDPVTYTVTFESNGGSIVAAITAEAGATVTAPAAPTKTDFMFDGWYSDSGLTTAYNFGLMPSQNVTIYAAWSENLTEAEYKVMVEEKLIELAKDYANSKEFNIENDIEIKAIDTKNGIFYATGTITGVGSRFMTIQFKSAVRDNLKGSTYLNLNENINNLSYTNIYQFKTDEMISTQVSKSSYNSFLNSVVTDPGFKTALEGAGINLPSGVDEWTDVATVVNVMRFGSQSMDISFIDLKNEKTITVRISSDLTLQESSTVQKQVGNTTIKNKVITVVGETKDFSTLPDVG